MPTASVSVVFTHDDGGKEYFSLQMSSCNMTLRREIERIPGDSLWVLFQPGPTTVNLSGMVESAHMSKEFKRGKRRNKGSRKGKAKAKRIRKVGRGEVSVRRRGKAVPGKRT